MSGGEFRRISSQRLWADGRMRALRRRSRDAHDLLVFLVTSPHTNLVGVFSLTPSHATADLCWSRPKFKAALASLQDEGLAFYDMDAEVIYVPAVLDWQPILTEDQAKGAVRRLQALPPTTLLDRLRQDLLTRGQAEVSEKVRSLLEYLGLTPPVPPVTPPVTPLARRGTPSPSPSQSPSQGPSPSPTGDGPLSGLSDAPNFHPRGRDGAPRTPGEILFEGFILPLTREVHRRDEWLRALVSPAAREAAQLAIERTTAAIDKGTVRNAGAFLWAQFQELARDA